MNRRIMSLVCLLVWSVPTAFAFDNLTADPDAQHCYGHAKLGFDSVINSRVGVPADLTLGIARIDLLAAISYEYYSPALVDVVLNAYTWPGSPHDNTMRVFYYCARDRAGMLSASSP